MSKTRDADVNEVAARVVRESTAKHETAASVKRKLHLMNWGA